MSPDSEPQEDNMIALKSLIPYHASKLRAFTTVPRVPLYINGKFVQSKTEEWIPVHNPVSALSMKSTLTLIRQTKRLFLSFHRPPKMS
jgi:hypothetical protein